MSGRRAQIISGKGLLRTIGIAATLLLVLFAAGAPDLRAADAEKSPPTAGSKPENPPKSAPDIEKLIEKLGDGSFAIRESATEELIRKGLSSKPHLMTALDDSDAEIRFRARRILTVILQEDFTKRLKAFAADTDGKRGLSMPGWKQFSEVVGGKPEARELFVQMQEAEPVLLEAYEKGPEPAAKALGERVSSLSDNNPRINLIQRRVASPVDVGSVAAILFVAGDTEVGLTDNSVARLISLPSKLASSGGIQNNESRRKLLGRWISRELPTNYLLQNIWLGVQFDLKEALIPAVKILESKDSPPNMQYPALIALAKLGGKEHLPLVAKFLDDRTVCGAFGLNNQRVTAEIRDVALMATIQLHGKDPREFGFDRIPQNARQPSNLHSIGFKSNEDRQAAFDKWAAAESQESKPNEKQATQEAAKKSKKS